MSNISNKNPLYSQEYESWVKMWDVYRGSQHIKMQGTKYLPPTSGMILDGMTPPTDANPYGAPGYAAYTAYKLRAKFPDYVKEAVESYIGLMHQKDAIIELPPEMEPLRKSATSDGEPLQALLRRMNEEQIITGRVGLLADLPVGNNPAALPYIALYGAMSIINWDDGQQEGGQQRMNLVVLNESGLRRVNVFDWEQKETYRVLMLGDPQENEAEGVYTQGVYTEETGFEYDAGKMSSPLFRNKPLNVIPFVIANTKDVLLTVDSPPLLKLAEECLSIYRSEADYRQNLFLQGQDTLVIIGDVPGKEANDPIRTGAGSYLRLGDGGDAKYVGVDSNGLSEQRTAIENDRKAAEARSGQLASPTSSQVESGDALEIRIAAQTATLTQIALTGAYALEKSLKIIAQWMGANPEQVSVRPNIDFASIGLQGQDANYWITAKAAGAPISLLSLHTLYAQRGLTNLDFNTEMSQIQKEKSQYAFLNPPAPVTTTPTSKTPAPTSKVQT